MHRPRQTWCSQGGRFLQYRVEVTRISLKDNSISLIICYDFTMNDWFSFIGRRSEFPAKIAQDLEDNGFVVFPGSIKSGDLPQLVSAYDSASLLASSDEIRIGSTSTRVNDFVNRGSEFDLLYVYRPLLEASFRVIGQPFKLSTMHARTLHPKVQAQNLHIDFKPKEEKFPLVSFIFMVDEFCSDNGATRFVPGSHKWSAVPNELSNDGLAEYENQTQTACGPAGSMIIFNGSVWHGYSANTTNMPRRSIQGAFIPRDEQAATDFSSRMRPETLSRISPLAKHLLAI